MVLLTNEVGIRVHRFDRFNHHMRETQDDPRVRSLFLPSLLDIRDAGVQTRQVVHELIIHGIVDFFLGFELFLAFVDLGDELGDCAVEVCVFCVVAAVGDDVLSDELVVEFELLEGFLLLAEVPFVLFYLLLLFLNFVGDLLVLFLDIY